jgi:hypothetical protein
MESSSLGLSTIHARDARRYADPARRAPAGTA